MSLLAQNPAAAIRPGGTLFAPIHIDLEGVENLLAETIGSRRPCLTPMIAHLEHHRGKRLRPALLRMTARACGRVTPDHCTLGADVGVLHTAALCHSAALGEAD